MSERTYLDYLEDIRDYLAKVQAFVAGMTFDDFSADEKTYLAVAHSLQIVGEAAKQLPPELRDRYPDLPWRAIAGMRDKLVPRNKPEDHLGSGYCGSARSGG